MENIQAKQKQAVSKTHTISRKPIHGFTLIELLVVIAIIALLLTIVMPALSRAKELAQRVICSSRIRQQCLGVMAYSSDNESYVPTTGMLPWFWDVSFWTTNEISRYAGFDSNKTFFCPSNKVKRHDDARIWQFSWFAYQPNMFGGADGSSPVRIIDESVNCSFLFLSPF